MFSSILMFFIKDPNAFSLTTWISTHGPDLETVLGFQGKKKIFGSKTPAHFLRDSKDT